MNSAASSSASSLAGGGDQIRFGTIDFLPHPPACLPAFVDLDKEMDLTFGSFNFLVGAKGSYRLSAPIFSGPSVETPGSPGSSTSSVDSSDEADSPPNCTNPAESGELADLFGGITFGSQSGTDLLQGVDSTNFTDRDSISNINFTASKEALADLFNGVACPS